MGFYHKKILGDKTSTMALICGNDEFVIPISDGFTINTGSEWTTGGDLLTAFKDGIVSGANSAISAAQTVVNTAAHAANSVAGTSFSGAAQYKLVTASDSFIKFAGSKQTDLELPNFSIIFINEDDTNAHVLKAKKLLEYVLPMVSENDGDIRYELAPNNFRTPNDGFNPNGISGSLSVRIGTRTLKYFVPTNVEIKISKDCSLVDNNIPQFITVSVALKPAYKYMAPDIKAML